MGLKDLAELKSLQFLDLASCPGVTDAGLKDLGAMKNLKYLRIYLTKVTAAGRCRTEKGFASSGRLLRRDTERHFENAHLAALPQCAGRSNDCSF